MAADQPTAEIALATYNGARYLPDFLASIAHQTWPALRLVVSDDGSTDGTVALIEGWSAHPASLSRNPGKRGFGHNFTHALAQTRAAYVLLADQDDVWMADKVARLMEKARAIEAERGVEHPVLVICDLQVVDGALDLIRPTYFDEGVEAIAGLGFADFLYSAWVPGCAMLVNRALLDRALPIPDDAPFHDWWLMLTAAGFGTVAAVPDALIQYRQHGGNTLGATPNALGLGGRLRIQLGRPIDYARERIATFRQMAVAMHRMLRAFDRQLGDHLPPDRRRALGRMLHGSRVANLLRFRRARAAGGRMARIALTLLRPSARDQASSGTSQ